MEFDTKIKIVLRSDLLEWQALNVTAFLMSGIAGTQDIVGEPYLDGDGVRYLPMSKQPIMIHEASSEELKTLVMKAVAKEMVLVIYTEELFHTYNDEDNRAMVRDIPTQELNLVGLAMRGKKNQVDRLFKGIPLHR